MDLLAIALNVVLGAALGTLGGLFGIGGGLIAIPALGVFFGLVCYRSDSLKFYELQGVRAIWL